MHNTIKTICIWNSLARTTAIPFTLFTARFMAGITEKAIAGAVLAVSGMALLLLALFAVSGMFQAGAEIMLRRQQAKALNRCRIVFLEQVLSNPLHRLCGIDPGELNENLNDDLAAWARRYTDGIPAIVSGAAGVAGYLGYLLYKGPAAAGTILLLALLQLFPPLVVKRYMRANYDQCRELEAKMTDHIVEAVKGFETIKLYGLQQWWMGKMTGLQKEYLRVGNRAEATATAQRTMYRLLDHILRYGTYAIMGMYVLAGYCDPDLAVEGIVLSGSLFMAVRQIFREIPEMAISDRAAKRLGRWNGWEQERRERGNVRQKENRRDTTIADHKIKVEILCYSHGEKRLFDKLSCTFSPENRYLLTGGNGVGKTTLLNLLSGLYCPDEGRILMDQEETDRLPAADYPWNIGYVLQKDPSFDFDADTLFSMFDGKRQGTVYAVAARLGLPTEAMRKVPIASLSGGERKKVFLAAGFAAGSRWLFLDEPSNHLDQCGKEALCELIRERKGVLVVSHDSALGRTADYILDVERDRLVWTFGRQPLSF